MEGKLKARLDEARRNTDCLFKTVRPDSMYERPIPERHRIIFYLGHLEAFDWNMLHEPLELPPFQADFDRLFSFGIDPKAGDLPDDQPADWPGEDEVRCYNAGVRERLDRALLRAPEDRLHVAIEHRLMHAETLAYMLHNLPYERKRGPAAGPVLSDSQPVQDMFSIPAGTATLGLRPGEAFGWDNEFEAHTVEVPAFRISRYKVTNGEYLEFVRQGAPAPFFWTEREGRWFWRGMFGEVPLPLNWPVYVTHDQAAAYAAFHGIALPTEAQWHRAAGTPATGNFDFRHWDPVPVDSEPDRGPWQMTGNGWEWTSTVFHPFPGFKPFSYYPGYSANFFDGEHYVMKGASPRTAACFTRPSFRNWFRPSYPYVYAGFRLVQN